MNSSRRDISRGAVLIAALVVLGGAGRADVPPVTALEAPGGAIDLSGELLVVGDTDATPNGSAFTYRWVGGAWQLEAELPSPLLDGNAAFGSAVAADGDLVVVGARNADLPAAPNAGAVVVYRWDGSEWREEQTLTSPDPQPDDRFGHDVAVSGNVVVVSAHLDDVDGITNRGSAWVFRLLGPSWQLEQQLLDPGGMANDHFGYDVDLEGDVIVVGARNDDVTNGGNEGTVRVYRWTGSSWIEEAVLGPPLQGVQQDFGASVSLSGSVLAVGSPYTPSPAPQHSGGLTVFRHDGSSWNQELHHVDLDGAQASGTQFFAQRVAASGDRVLAASEEFTKVFLWDGTSWLAGPILVVDAWDDPSAEELALDGDHLVIEELVVHLDAFAAWSDQGSGLPGAWGPPLLSGHGVLVAGSAGCVDVRYLPALSLAGLLVAPSSTPVPFKGGTLLAFPADPLVFATGAGSQGLTQEAFPFTMPAGVPVGTGVWIQCAAQDPAAVKGVSLSNAMLGLTP